MEAIKLKHAPLTVVKGINILGLYGQIGTHKASKERWKHRATELLKEKHRLRNELKKVASQLVESRLRIQRLEMSLAASQDTTPDLQKRIPAEDIITIVAAYKGVSIADIKGRCRSAELVYPRQLCYYLCAKYSPLPLIAIGKLFSRDHTTVISGREKIDTFKDLYDDVRQDVNHLKALIENI